MPQCTVGKVPWDWKSVKNHRSVWHSPVGPRNVIQTPTGHQSQEIKLCPLGGSCKTWTARCKNQGTSLCVKVPSRRHSGLWNTAETKWKIAFLLPILWRGYHQPLHVYLIGSQTFRLQLLLIGILHGKTEFLALLPPAVPEDGSCF